MTADEAIAIVESKARGRTRYEGQEPFESPYRDIQEGTQRLYSKVLRLLLTRADISECYIDELTGGDARRWFRAMCETKSVNYSLLMISVFKAVISYGASQGYEN